MYFQNYNDDPKQAIEFMGKFLEDTSFVFHYCPPFTLVEFWIRVVDIVKQMFENTEVKLYVSDNK